MGEPLASSLEEDKKRTIAKFVAPIDEAELSCRILEAMMDPPVPRPAGLSANQALAISDPECVEMVRRAARAAMEYWRECIQNAQRPS